MLLNLIATLSLLLAVIGYFMDMYEILFTPVAFLIVYFALVVVWLVFTFVATRFVNMKKDYEKRSGLYRWLVNCVVESTAQIFRAKLKVSGEEKLPQEKFLLVCNHRGILDPLVTMRVLRKYNMGFVAKKVIYQIPILCRLMHRCYCLCLDRDNMKQMAQTISRAAYFIKNDFASIGIYPEGERSQKKEMLPFMHGAFKVAKKAECPIVVATIANTEKATKRFWYRSTEI